jgi:hypothetical protein
MSAAAVPRSAVDAPGEGFQYGMACGADFYRTALYVAA